MLSVPQTWESVLKSPASTDHLVQLYRDDRFLAEAVTLFTRAGLDEGEAVILVATRPHWEAFSERLKSSRDDVAGLQASGQLTVVDAEDTLPTVMADGMPDVDTFNRLASNLVAQARARGYSQVRWWGEMVGLLWQQGNLRGSLKMEQLTNDLAKRHHIPIACSFSMDAFDPKIYGEPLDGLCHTHSHLIPVEDNERFYMAVNRAIDEVCGPLQSLRVRAVVAIYRSKTRMPSSQELLMWLMKMLPSTGKLILSLAREHYNGPKNG